MKTRIIIFLFYAAVLTISGMAQLNKYCTPLPKPNPRAPEPFFQLPMEVGDGVKFYQNSVDPYFAYFNILPTLSVWERTLKIGIGPEVMWSDEVPCVTGKLKASFDLWDIAVTSFNNIPIGSLLFSLWGGWGIHAPTFGAGFSFEINWFISAGAGTDYFTDKKSASFIKQLTLNPFFYRGKNEPVSSAIPSNQNLEDQYYMAFTNTSRSFLQSDSTLLKLVRKAADDKGWNNIYNISTLENYMNSLAPGNGASFISRIIEQSRNLNELDNIKITEDEQKVVFAILKGICLSASGGSNE